MADGTYRFQQSAGQQYYYPQSHQAHHQRHLQRNGSPVSSGRVPFSHDTPSPTHSPGPQSPAHSLFGMYNQGQQQGQHPLMNGGPPNRGFPMPMNLAPHKYQNHATQHQQPQQDHGNHVQGGVGHQHTYSAGGLSSTTPHFTPSHLQNGGQGSLQNGTTNFSEDWQRQAQMVHEVRLATSPNHWSRKLGPLNVPLGNPNAAKGKEEEKEETNRAITTNDEAPRQDWVALDIGGHGLRTISPVLFLHYTFLDKLYLNGNKLEKLPAAIGRLRNLSYLDVSTNMLRVLPSELGMLVKLRILLLFDNDLRRLPAAIGSMYRLETLGIEGNPIDDDQTSEMKYNGTTALVTQLREQAERPEPPSQRDWIILDDTISTSSPPPETFSVLTYNTLCKRYATHKQYGYTPSWALSWDYRKELILQEIRAHNADIVCLQEVDMDSFDEFFRVQLAYNDYKGVFWPRPRAKTMAEKEAKAVDGCATFYKGSKYIILDKQIIDLANTAINRPDMKGENDIYNRVMPRDNIAVSTFFENRQTGSRLTVVNAHIFWDPAFKDVKLVQTAILMDQVSKLADKYAKIPPCTDKVAFKLSNDTDGTDGSSPEEPPPEPAPSMDYSSGSQIPLVMCGDFNSTVGSGVYDLITQGTLPKDHPDLVDWRYGNFTRDGMAHPFSLKSSYASIGELSFTNYTPSFTDIIDYIWYSTNALQVAGLLGEVDKDYLRTVPGFPNYHFPSDHLALLAEFTVKGRKEKRVLPEPDFGSGNSGRRRD
ncbi:MAG: Glucose-repressible alcohol dehydrogenase transcriptional effector [Sclerophora amabilis]|nr:MAG: Glucose-repressible alcohol dehydrogenase transcriptional effector [Sclerophora amabilis]